MFTAMFGLLAKYAIWNKIKATGAFILTHWRVFLVLAILGYAAYQFNALRIERDDAKQALSDRINAESEAVAKNAADIAAKEMQAKIDNALGEFRHQQDLDTFKINQAEAIKNLKDQYEKRIAGTNLNWSERVRLEASRKADGMPEARTDPGLPTPSVSEYNRAYITLEDACRITTSDYNRLRVWADAACKQVGCK